jgi:hypothetical protein
MIIKSGINIVGSLILLLILARFGSHRRGDQVDLQRVGQLQAKNGLVSSGMVFNF